LGYCRHEIPEILYKRKDIPMRKYMLIGISLLLLCGTSLNAMADDFDGSRELMCACARIIECTPDGNCREVQAEDVGVPEFLRINFEKRPLPRPCGGKRRPLPGSKIWNVLTAS